MRKTNFTNESFYHIYNRGTEKRDIFLQNYDYFQFIKLLRKYKNNLVEIICYCLMPNHFHLLLKQLNNNGISKFMHLLTISYAKYFNKKYDHSGVLFQGKFKDVQILSYIQLLNISKYIHINPAKDQNILLKQKIITLENYPWSSYKDYINIRNGTLCNKTEIINCVEGNFVKEYKELIKAHLMNYNERNLDKLILE
ncbi:MAG: transposase [Patescibacteria group bacterium]